MTEDGQLTFGEAEIAKREGMERVERHAEAMWKAAAFEAVILAAMRYDEFTSDDVMELIPPEYWTHDRRAMGPVMLAAAKAGLIHKTGRVRNSNRRSLHASPRQIWTRTRRS